MTDELYWSILIMLIVLGPLVLGAIVVEEIAPRTRDLRRRIRRHRAGRKAMARQNAEAEARLDAERRQAAEWIAANCYWHGERHE